MNEQAVDKNASYPISILMAEDDADDRLLVQEAFDESRIANDIHFVEDGEELMDYLHRHGKYRGDEPVLPDLILLDLNMPRKDGREALKEIKEDSGLRHIPVVILTTSKAEEDILRTYQLGVAGFIVKPVSFQGLVDVLKSLGRYWVQIVELPREHRP